MFAHGCAGEKDCSPALAVRVASDGSCVQPIDYAEVLECEVDPKKATDLFCVRDSTGALLLALVKHGNVLELGNAVPESLLNPEERAQCEAAKASYAREGGAYCEPNGVFQSRP